MRREQLLAMALKGSVAEPLFKVLPFKERACQPNVH